MEASLIVLLDASEKVLQGVFFLLVFFRKGGFFVGIVPFEQVAQFFPNPVAGRKDSVEADAKHLCDFLVAHSGTD